MTAQDVAVSHKSSPPSLRLARSSLALALLARIPIGGLSLLFILAARESGTSFGMAGLTSAACAIGVAVSAPLTGRLADRIGQTPVLYASAAATAATMLTFGMLSQTAPVAVLPALALLCGLALPPTSSSARVVWRWMLPAAAFDRLVTLDATLQELAFLLGPLLMLGLAARTSAHTVIAATGLVWALITVAFGSLAETRQVKGSRGVTGRGLVGPVRCAAVRTQLLIALTLGIGVGATEIGIITLMQASGTEAWLSLVYVIWALSSAVGGLLAMRYPTERLTRRLVALLASCSLSTAALALATGPVSLAFLLPFAGAGFAPLLALQASALAVVTPAAMMTEAYGLYAAAITVGVAVGTAVGGLVVGDGSYRAAFVAGAVALAAGTLKYCSVARESRPKIFVSS
ncbi:MFS transporter [uncultured Jatrophihabitans sp.]|uniref:MFS transporter n=1 Tax=uncultured Jatrophihabitans sp. TaxID=1610747 RepID=UPI0035CA8C71